MQHVTSDGNYNTFLSVHPIELPACKFLSVHPLKELPARNTAVLKHRYRTEIRRSLLYNQTLLI